MLLSTKKATLAVKILSLLLIAALSFFIVAEKLPKSPFIESSLESVEESNNIVMRLSAATLSTSLAISALPDDFASPLADTLTDMNIFFVFILAILLFEKVLILFGTNLAFTIVLPLSCAVGIISIFTKKVSFKFLAIRICALGLSLALVVPCSTFIANYVAVDLTEYVNSTIQETEAGADKLNKAMESESSDKTIFENLSDLFQTAIHGVSDLMLHFQNIIRKCMNSIAIMLLTNFLTPLLTFFLLKWILKETFGVIIPTPAISHHDIERIISKTNRHSTPNLAATGAPNYEE